MGNDVTRERYKIDNTYFIREPELLRLMFGLRLRVSKRDVAHWIIEVVLRDVRKSAELHRIAKDFGERQ